MKKLLLRTYEKVKGAGDYELEVMSRPDIEITPEQLDKIFRRAIQLGVDETHNWPHIPSPENIKKALEEL